MNSHTHVAFRNYINFLHFEVWGENTHHVEVQAINANAGIVLDAQIDMLLDAKAKVSTVGEVVLPQLVLTHLITASKGKTINTSSSPAYLSYLNQGFQSLEISHSVHDTTIHNTISTQTGSKATS